MSITEITDRRRRSLVLHNHHDSGQILLLFSCFVHGWCNRYAVRCDCDDGVATVRERYTLRGARRDRSASISGLADEGVSRGRISAFAASRRPDGALWCNTSKGNGSTLNVRIESVHAFAEWKKKRARVRVYFI